MRNVTHVQYGNAPWNGALVSISLKALLYVDLTLLISMCIVQYPFSYFFGQESISV